jgi:hypothetical protein
MNLAPIVLFVYNRPLHTEQTLEALMANELANESILYIYADGAKVNSDESTLKAISATRAIIRKKQWCNEVCIIEREINLGLAENIIDGVNNIINKYESVIVLEDDIKTASNFLVFMNKALKFYENCDKTFGISGYCYPKSKNLKSTHTYFLPISCSWSWATWKHTWDMVNFNTNELIEFINKNNLKKKMNFGYYPFFEMLEKQSLNQINSWAIRFYTSMFLCEKWFVYPPISMVQNIGFGNYSTHTQASDNFFDKVTIEDQIKIEYLPFFKSKELTSTKNKFREQYNPNFKSLALLKKNVKTIIKKIF